MAGKRTPASSVALGGVLAALAVVIMSLGTIIPVATYDTSRTEYKLYEWPCQP